MKSTEKPALRAAIATIYSIARRRPPRLSVSTAPSPSGDQYPGGVGLVGLDEHDPRRSSSNRVVQVTPYPAFPQLIGVRRSLDSY